MTTRGFHKINLVLSGSDNQDIRLLIRVSRLRFIAINDSGQPLMEELLSLAEGCSAIRKALLALAGLLRVQSHQTMCLGASGDEEQEKCPHLLASTAAFERYQVALFTLRERISTLQPDKACENDVLEVLGSALLLTMAGFPRTIQPEGSHDWSHHMRGMISLVESLDPSLIAHSGIGRLLKDLVAYLDIGAFALGRKKTHNAWLRWDIYPPEAPRPPDFSPMEVSVGYPKSLLTIIATISAILEDLDEDTLLFVIDLVDRLHRKSRFTDQRATTATSLEPGLSINNISATIVFKLETVLMRWEPPHIPERFPGHTAIALTGAWEIMRKATLVYLWRGGFRANILESFPSHRKSVATQYIREILFGLHTLLGLWETHSITMMNVMTWPLIVVGNECGNNPQLQHEVEWMLCKIQQQFQIEHLKHLSPMLKELWRAVEAQSDDFCGPVQSITVSLDSLSRKSGVCLPLF